MRLDLDSTCSLYYKLTLGIRTPKARYKKSPQVGAIRLASDTFNITLSQMNVKYRNVLSGRHGL